MKERSVTHATLVIERSYPTTPQRVFAAFSDPAKKRRWFAGDKEFRAEEFEMDFWVRGRERSSFQAQGVTCTNETVYLDIVPHSRIVMAYTMTLGDQRLVVSRHHGVSANGTGNRSHLHRTGRILRRRGWPQNPGRGLAHVA
jgi:uncharacterized protein YndB with AHSA1/START domain